jgi:hypothetical protein
MAKRKFRDARLKARLPFVCIAFFMAILWAAGGASRADVLAQAVTRAAAWLIVIACLLLIDRPPLRSVRPVALFTFAAVALAALQLVPLPPSLWMALPGHELLAKAAIVSGQHQPWRPISISPGATVNALSSLIVPVVTLWLMAGLARAEHWRLLSLLLSLIIFSAVIGLMQFSGGRFDHPLLNDVEGMVSSTFANRNHFALFAAIGCVLAPTWAFREEGNVPWKAFAALGLTLFLLLIILATGSRMGMVLGGTAVILALYSNARQIRVAFAQVPRKFAVLGASATVGVLLSVIGLSIVLGRAASVNRAFSLDVGDDLRARALPTVLRMVREYFPVGSGFGTFDPAYRIHEAEKLLDYSYFNHAHTDLIEVVLEGGVLSASLLAAGIFWWGFQSFGVWRAARRSSSLARAGSIILLLIVIASSTDYPARTPMIMALGVIAAVWTCAPWRQERKSSGAKLTDSNR